MSSVEFFSVPKQASALMFSSYCFSLLRLLTWTPGKTILLASILMGSWWPGPSSTSAQGPQASARSSQAWGPTCSCFHCGSGPRSSGTTSCVQVQSFSEPEPKEWENVCIYTFIKASQIARGCQSLGDPCWGLLEFCSWILQPSPVLFSEASQLYLTD